MMKNNEVRVFFINTQHHIKLYKPMPKTSEIKNNKDHILKPETFAEPKTLTLS